MEKLAQGFNTAAQDSNPGPLSRESDTLPLSHGAHMHDIILGHTTDNVLLTRRGVDSFQICIIIAKDQNCISSAKSG